MSKLSNAIIVVLAGLYLVSCGKDKPRPAPQPPVQVREIDGGEAALNAGFRYKDIAGRPYSPQFIRSFSYGNSQVAVQLRDHGPRGMWVHVNASGLKPNFAYQLKLMGNPELDPRTNERLGRMGRWWRSGPDAGNAKDEDVDTRRGHYTGYLVMGFFVTDSRGNANANFLAANSYHVVWRLDQRHPEQNDGPPLTVVLPETSGNPAYAEALPSEEVTLYGEWEPTRVLPGALEMIRGHYRCNLVLTEESFHDTDHLGGRWAHALVFPQEFDIR